MTVLKRRSSLRTLLRLSHISVSCLRECVDETRQPADAVSGCNSDLAWQSLVDVSTEVCEGRVHAFLTEGVSPILRVVARFVQPDEGRVLWSGSFFGWRRMRPLVFVPRGARLLSDLTVREELLTVLAACGANVDADVFARVMRVFRLEDVRDVRVCELPVEDAYRVLIARSAVVGARLIVLDEPTLGMTSSAAAVLLEVLSVASREGFAVVLQTRAPQVAAQCDRVSLLVGGVLRGEFDAPNAELLRLEFAQAVGESLPGDALSLAVEGERGSGVADDEGGAEAFEDAVSFLPGEDARPQWVPTRRKDIPGFTPLPDASISAVRVVSASDEDGLAGFGVEESLGGEDAGAEVEGSLDGRAPVGVISQADEVIARAQVILRDLPGSVVPDAAGVEGLEGSVSGCGVGKGSDLS